MRGERHADGSAEHVARGSSPHARGTPSTCYGKDGFPRFIPACAGNASGAFDDVQILAVHPRMRGERMVPTGCVAVVDGSSPHARGTPGSWVLMTLGFRFIPACAGNANWAPPRTSAPAVHPRMRGERLVLQQPGVTDRGSSPHARGTLPTGRAPTAGTRFIPACAGNAINLLQRLPLAPVHPRMRGER